MAYSDFDKIEALYAYFSSIFPIDDSNETLLNMYYYRPPEGGRLYDMKVVSGYAFLRTYFV